VNRQGKRLNGPYAQRRKRAAAQQQIDERRRETEASRRRLLSVFGMWTICPDKRCIRAQACAGDVEQCLRQRWHKVVPPETKALLQKFFTLTKEGMPPAEALAAAQKDMERRIRMQAEFDARAPEREPPRPPAPAKITRSAARRPGPRVRGL
jgi:hypothetical protein